MREYIRLFAAEPDQGGATLPLIALADMMYRNSGPAIRPDAEISRSITNFPKAVVKVIDTISPRANKEFRIASAWTVPECFWVGWRAEEEVEG
jgi:hypothetical protein